MALSWVGEPFALQPASAQSADTEPQYGGVVPGDASSPGKRKRPDRVTWIGHQPRSGGGSRLFVQLTSEVAYDQEVRGDVLVVKLEGARYGRRSVGRRLDMRFFDSVLAQVSTKRVGKRRARGDRGPQSAGVELRIEFKDGEDARAAAASLRAEPDGYHYLYLDFEAASL
ncbi:MAG: hypothetical protein Tsb0020_51390 [Haliangiales bacterium]